MNASSIIETLPADADEDTIEASVENGKLSISISKKVVEEDDRRDEGDNTVVRVNRKNRK